MLGALVAYEFILFAIDGWTGHPITSPLRWIHALTGATHLAARGRRPRSCARHALIRAKQIMQSVRIKDH